MARLPVGETVRSALKAPFVHWRALLPAYVLLILVPWAVVIGLWMYLFQGIDGETPVLEGLAVFVPLMLLGYVVAGVATAAYVVLVHRTVAQVDEPWSLVGPTLKYILFLVLIGILIQLPLIGVMPIAASVIAKFAEPALRDGNFALFAFAMMIPMLLVMTLMTPLLMLALPAVALRRPHALSLGWRLGTENYLPLLGGFVIVGIVCAVPGYGPDIYVLLTEGWPAMPPMPEQAEGTGGFPDTGEFLVQLASTLAYYAVVSYFTVTWGVAFMTHAFLTLEPEAETAPVSA